MSAVVATVDWSLGLIVAILIGMLALYLRDRRRLCRAGRGHEVSRARVARFAAGWLVLLVAMVGPLDWTGEQRLMSAHMLQHILIMSVAPGLLLSGLPARTLAAAAARLPAFGRPTLGSAAACLIVGIAAIWVMHVPAVLEPGLRYPPLNDMQHVALLLAGGLVTWPLLGAVRLNGMPAVAFVAVGELAFGVLGIWLTWYPQVAYGFYEQVPRTWGLSAQTDQSLAGALLLALEEPFLAIEFAVLFIRALSDSERDEDDAHLDSVLNHGQPT